MNKKDTFRILFVTPTYKDVVVGPAKYARILKNYLGDQIDILTENTEDENIISIDVNMGLLKRKLGQYFSKFLYQNKTKELLKNNSEYTHIIFNNGITGTGFKVDKHSEIIIFHMINHEKYDYLKPAFRLRYLADLFYNWIEKRTIKQGDNLIVNSHYLKNKLINDFEINPEKVFVLHKSIIIEKYNFSTSRINSEGIIKILFVKNDWERGGLEELASALNILENFHFRISVIGPGSSEQNSIQKLFEGKSNIELQFLGYRNEESVIEALDSHDILCVPSRSEALGVIFMEGLAAGIPIVTTNVGGIKEVTNNGDFVWAAEPYQPSDLAEKIHNCIKSPDERISKSVKGRSFIETHFNHKKMLKELKEIIGV
ncbi:MAG: glycosyltransferase family 4 protein [Saprospiraceae bacterium]|nr:glycosyltransferase family 4 protein [Saprospiraceae bacterium]